MAPSEPTKGSKKKLVTIGQMVKKRLKELESTPEDLAAAIDIPVAYVEDLMAGRRTPPAPGRTDIYAGMTTFLKLARNELATIAEEEREAVAATKPKAIKADVVRALLALCEPETAKDLAKRARRAGGVEFWTIVQRLLDATRGMIRRSLNDHAALRTTAGRSAVPYSALRMQILDFLEVTPSTLTTEDVAKFLTPYVAKWDFDRETGIMRVVQPSTHL